MMTEMRLERTKRAYPASHETALFLYRTLYDDGTSSIVRT